MGYYVKTKEVNFTLKAKYKNAAYVALCALNNNNRIKSGGVYPIDRTTVGPNPNIWFSWMDWNYPETCENLNSLLDHLGFDVYTNSDGDIIDLFYDKKMGDEWLFLEALAPYVENGSYILFVGEDNSAWRFVYVNGGVYREIGQLEFKVHDIEGTYAESST